MPSQSPPWLGVFSLYSIVLIFWGFFPTYFWTVKILLLLLFSLLGYRLIFLKIFFSSLFTSFFSEISLRTLFEGSYPHICDLWLTLLVLMVPLNPSTHQPTATHRHTPPYPLTSSPSFVLEWRVRSLRCLLLILHFSFSSLYSYD